MLNEKLRKAREQKRWTIEAAADKVGVSWLTYSRWERGTHKPHLSTLDMLCQAFDMSPEDLGLALSPRTETRNAAQLSIHQSSHGTSIIVLTDEQITTLTGLLAGDNTMKFDASRRKTLQQLLGITGITAIIPTQELLNPEPWERLSQASNINTEALRHFGKLTDTCWHLYNASEASTVEHILPTYLPKVETLVRQPSKYQKAAAGITSQGYILAAEVDKGNISLMERFCDLAVEYSQIAEDHNLQVAALKQQATIALVARKTEKALQIYLRALPFIHYVSPLLRSRIYMGLASAYARCGQKQEALRYIGLAHEAFPEYPEDDPSFLYTVCNTPVLYLYDGLTYMDINEPQAAWDALSHVDGLQPKMPVPESSRIEIINLQASAAVALGDMERGCTYAEAGIRTARIQGYDLWANKSYDVYQQMKYKWTNEPQVHALSELFHQ